MYFVVFTNQGCLKQREIKKNIQTSTTHLREDIIKRSSLLSALSDTPKVVLDPAHVPNINRDKRDSSL